MTEITIERPPATEREEVPFTPMLFRVWIDTACGYAAPDWELDIDDPEPLGQALDHAAQLRASNWLVLVLPEHSDPRPDGRRDRWDNP